MDRVCSISIDLDPIPCYYRIHGLGEAPQPLRDVVLRRCVPRFAELLGRRGISATFFVVGEDVDPEVLGQLGRSGAASIGELVAAGHEIGNHSYSHPYDLARLSSEEIGDQIVRADPVLRKAIGRPLRGFRAPGYDVSAPVLDHLLALGYRYDSSIFPAPGYYLAKAAVMAGLAIAGRRSGAVLTDPRALVAPAEPYRPRAGAPWRRGQMPIVELPIAVTPWLRVPAIGTSLLVAPAWLRRRWLAAMERRPFFNLELHGIDLCDADEDGIPGALVARQPDLRLPVARKLELLEETLDRVAEGFSFATLDEVAAWAHRELA